MKLIISAGRILAAGAAMLILPALAGAQEPGIAFDQLHRWLNTGDVVWLTDAQGREIKGKVSDIQASSLVLEADGTKTFQASDVRQLVERGSRSTKACALWGLAGGTGAGVLAALATRGPLSTTWCVGTVPADVACSPTRTGLATKRGSWFPSVLVWGWLSGPSSHRMPWDRSASSTERQAASHLPA